MRFRLLLLSAALAATAYGLTGMAPVASKHALTDAERLHVFITSNRAEILTSEPLLDDLANPDVRQFAGMMVDRHSRVFEQAEALDLEPQDNPISETMTQMVMGKAEALGLMNGPELDTKYMETQVVLHGQSLDIIDHVLIPNAEDPQFRALLEQTRPAVEQHLRMAEQLHHQLMPMADTDGMSGTDDGGAP